MTRVAIVGGGIGGLTAAIALREAGLHPTLYEQHERIAPVGSGISLSAPPLTVLRRLGVEADEIGIPVELDFARADGRTRTGVISRPDLEAGFGASVYSMMRPALHDALLARIDADALRPSARLERFMDTGDAVELHFADGSTATADLVIGADGLHSVVREQLWGYAPLRAHNLVAWQGWSDYDGRPPREGRIMHNRDSQVGHLALRLPGGRIGRQWWYIERGRPGGRVEPGSLARLQREIAAGGWDPFVAECLAATDPAVVIRRDILDRRPLPRWSRGRVTLLGDAAHATSPYAGYGAGMAIEDAWQLSKHLRGADLADAAGLARRLGAYDDARVRHTTRTVEFARVLGTVFHNRSRLAQSVRDALLDRTPLGKWALSYGYLDGLAKEMQRL